MKTVKKIGVVIANVVLWFIIIIVAFFAIVTFSRKGNGGVASLMGYTPMTVLTDSMAPKFKADDLIVVKAGDKSSYNTGDIISFWTVIENARVINTHRIVEVIKSGDMVQYITRGDANSENDNLLVSTGDVIGKYAFSIPFLGKVLTLVSSSVGFLVIIVLPLLVFFIYQLYKLIMLLVELKKQTVIEATKQAMQQIEEEKNRAQQEKTDSVPEDKESK